MKMIMYEYGPQVNFVRQYNQSVNGQDQMKGQVKQIKGISVCALDRPRTYLIYISLKVVPHPLKKRVT
jgi:hypothetical protein